MKDYHRQDLLSLAYNMGVEIRSDADLIQFECEMILNGDLEIEDNVEVDLKSVSENSDISETLNKIIQTNNNVEEYLKQILNTVSNTDSALNPKPSSYQSKKELISAKAKADIKRDTITNKRK